MFSFFMAAFAASQFTYPVRRTINLPSYGKVSSLVRAGRHSVLLGADNAKAILNITSLSLVHGWTETDSFYRRPFVLDKFNHEQDFTFYKLEDSSIKKYQYIWWQVNQLSSLGITNAVVYGPGATLDTSGILNPASYPGAYADMDQDGNGFVAIAGPSSIQVFQLSSLSSSNTDLCLQVSGLYTKVQFYSDPATTTFALAGQTASGVDYGLVSLTIPPTNTISPSSLSHSVAGGTLLASNKEGFFISWSNYLYFYYSSGSLLFNISIGFHAESVVDLDFMTAYKYMAVGGIGKVLVLMSCADNCVTCNGVASYQCLSCAPGFNLVNNTCTGANCPTGFAMTVYGCWWCSGWSVTCINGRDLRCKSGFFLSDNLCNYYCPSHYLPKLSTSTCDWVNCPEGQLWSDLQLKCLICSPDKGYFNTYTGICDKCPALCDTCTRGPVCLTCIKGVFLNNGLCYLDCPYFTEPDYQLMVCLTCPIYYEPIARVCMSVCPINCFPSQSRTCQPCNTPCFSCLDQKYCLTCLAGLAHLGSCVAQCPPFYSISQSKCVLCTQYFMTSTLECLQVCRDGYYPDSASYCQPCDPSCYTCNAAGPASCTSCRLGTFNYGGLCVSNCPPTFFEDRLAKSCVSCPSNCLSCSNSTVCLTCTSPFLLLDSACVAVCPAQFFSNTTHCLPCSQFCVKLKFQPTSYKLQPYSNLKVALIFSQSVPLATVQGSVSVSGNYGTLSIYQDQPNRFTIQLQPPNAASLLLDSPISISFFDSGQLADLLYRFDPSSFRTQSFEFNYMPVPPGRMTALSEFLNLSYEAIPAAARQAFTLAIHHPSSQMTLNSKLTISKQELDLHSLFAIGSMGKLRHWRSKSLSTQGRRALSLTIQQPQNVLAYRSLVLAFVLTSLLCIAAVQLLKYNEVIKKDRTGIHWAVGDFLQYTAAQILFLDLAVWLPRPDVPTWNKVLIAISSFYLFCYFMFRFYRYLRLTSTSLVASQLPLLAKEFEFQLIHFKFEKKRHLLTEFISILTVRYYPFSCFLMLNVKITFFFNLSADPLSLFCSLLVITAVQLLLLAIQRPYHRLVNNLLAGGELVMQSLGYGCCIATSLLFNQLRLGSISSIGSYNVFGWAGLALLAAKVLLQILLRGSLLYQYIKGDGITEYQEKIRRYFEEEVTLRGISTLQVQLCIQGGNLNKADLSQLGVIYHPILVILLDKEKVKVFSRQVTLLKMNQQSRFNQRNNLRAVKGKQGVFNLGVKAAEEVQLCFSQLLRDIKAEDALQLQLVFMQKVDQRELRFGQRVDIRTDYDSVAVTWQVGVHKEQRSFRKEITAKMRLGGRLDYIFKKFYQPGLSTETKAQSAS